MSNNIEYLASKNLVNESYDLSMSYVDALKDSYNYPADRLLIVTTPCTIQKEGNGAHVMIETHPFLYCVSLQLKFNESIPSHITLDELNKSIASESTILLDKSKFNGLISNWIDIGSRIKVHSKCKVIVPRASNLVSAVAKYCIIVSEVNNDDMSHLASKYNLDNDEFISLLKHEYNMLMTAASKNYLEIFIYLFDKIVKADGSNYNSEMCLKTSLLFAVNSKSVDVCRYILNNFEIPKHHFTEALNCAVTKGFIDIVGLFFLYKNKQNEASSQPPSNGTSVTRDERVGFDLAIRGEL